MKKKPITHEVKVKTEEYDAILSGDKTFVVLKNDQDFQVGDLVYFTEWDFEKDVFLESKTMYRTCYMVTGDGNGIQEGYCVLGIV